MSPVCGVQLPRQNGPDTALPLCQPHTGQPGLSGPIRAPSLCRPERACSSPAHQGPASCPACSLQPRTLWPQASEGDLPVPQHTSPLQFSAPSHSPRKPSLVPPLSRLRSAKGLSAEPGPTWITHRTAGFPQDCQAPTALRSGSREGLPFPQGQGALAPPGEHPFPKYRPGADCWGHAGERQSLPSRC